MSAPECTHPLDVIVVGGLVPAPHCGLCGCPVALAVDGLRGGYLQAIGEPNELVLDQGDPRPLRAVFCGMVDEARGGR